mmetsp:Transcript_68783/g.194112  ORF Transcript_68783/g.194112 Transcript_68783/m.194112 type:complete len:324 (-) Transcript_68783:21-992(-)
MDLASCDRVLEKTMCRSRRAEKCLKMVTTSHTSSMKPMRIISSVSSRAKTCTPLRSTPRDGASCSRGSTRAGWPKTTAGLSSARAEDSRSRSSTGFTPAIVLSGSRGSPPKVTFRLVPSKHSRAARWAPEHILKYFPKSPVVPVERTTARTPGTSVAESMAAKRPRTSADVFPHWGAPCTVTKPFWSSSWKAALTSGTTKRCMSRGFSHPQSRRSRCISPPFDFESWLKSARTPAEALFGRAFDDSENTSMLLRSRAATLGSCDESVLIVVPSDIVDKKLSSRLPFRRCCRGCSIAIMLPALRPPLPACGSSAPGCCCGGDAR